MALVKMIIPSDAPISPLAITISIIGWSSFMFTGPSPRNAKTWFRSPRSELSTVHSQMSA